MHAVIRDGSQQFRVEEGSVISIERYGLEAGTTHNFDVLLLTTKDGSTTIGAPFIHGAKVEGEVLGEDRGRKLIVYTFKRRKGYSRKKGHRQVGTRVKITSIKAK